MDLSTSYMGLKLKNPLIIGSSRITGELKTIQQCISFGAGAVVLKSIFEEQISRKAETNLKLGRENEAYYWFPEARENVLSLSKEAGLDYYLRFIESIKTSSDVPVISSIHCVSAEGWPKFAKRIESAGADALELNISVFPFNKSMTSAEIENTYIEIVKAVKKEVKIPVSVKLAPFFTNICSIVDRIVDAGADGLVLFNRFFHPDIDIDNLKVIAHEPYSSPDEMSLPLRWIALLKGHNIPCDIAASTGVHYHTGVIKQILVGASAVQLCSTLYLNGIPQIGKILDGMEKWMKDHHYEELDDFRGESLNQQTVDSNFERIQYMRLDFDENS
ncbi:MAG: dihydroorotate dehydrogenase-like protein [Bacteroidales bacterium]|nr:dihydroorotate dehydrogenase-like protein [Bacteroidales bacterium]